MALKTKGHHYRHDIGRADILFSSLRQYTQPSDFDQILVIVPSDETQAVEGYSKNWRPFAVRVVDEGRYLGAFQKHSRPHEVRSWHRQQIVKLFAGELVRTEFFLVVDSDMFATRPFRAKDLLRDGKALMETGPRSVHADWWKASASLLALDAASSTIGLRVTPAILSKTICRALRTALTRIHGTEWHEVLLRNHTIDWSEYTLYYLIAESEGLLDAYHVVCESNDPFKLHNDVSVWRRHDWQRFDTERCFAVDTPGVFSVVQSNTGITPEMIRSRIGHEIDIRIQPYGSGRASFKRVIEAYGEIRRKVIQRFRD
jgi:hypothetical protein